MGIKKLLEAIYERDFVVCFEREEDAKGFGEKLRQRLGKFGLKVTERDVQGRP